MYKKILGLFLYWRLFLFLPLFVAHLVIPQRRGYEYTLLPYYIKTASPLNHFFLSPFANFDGVYYMMISGVGYTVNAGFFPFFPLLVKFFTLPFGQIDPFAMTQYVVATLLVSGLTLGSLVLLYKLVLFDFSKSIAMQSIIGLLFFPTAFFLASFYSESLFLFLSLTAFYFARKRKWWLSGLAGVFLSATRVVGIVLLPALLWEWFVWWRDKKVKKTTKSVLTSLLPIFLTPLGLLGYMVYNFTKWGDSLFFVHAQGNFFNNRSVSSIVLFPQTVLRYAKILTTVSSRQFEWWIALLEVASVFFALTMLYFAWKKRVRISYILFAVCALLIPGSTGTFTGMPRYTLTLFPVFIAVALIKNTYVRYSLYTVFFLLQILLFTLFAKGYFIS